MVDSFLPELKLFFILNISIFIIFLFFLIYIFICQYILLKHMNFAHPFLGTLIPYYNVYSLGKIATGDEDEIEFFGKKINSKFIHYWWIFYLLFALIPKIGELLGLLLSVCMYQWIFTKLEEKITGRNIKDISTFKQVVYGLIPFIGVIINAKYIIDKK